MFLAGFIITRTLADENHFFFEVLFLSKVELAIITPIIKVDLLNRLQKMALDEKFFIAMSIVPVIGNFWHRAIFKYFTR